MIGIFTSILAGESARQGFSSPTVGIGAPHPPDFCTSGGEWRALDGLANASRVPTKNSVKNEDPPEAAPTPLKTRGASICDGFPPLNLSRTKPGDGGRAAAPLRLLFLPGDRAVDPLLGNPPRHPAWHTELRSIRISDSNAVESDLFSVSSGYADWQRACASFDRADSSLLEVEEEVEWADQALGDPYSYSLPRRRYAHSPNLHP